MSVIQPHVIKTCWLSGISREDCAAMIILQRVKSFGIVREKAVYSAIDAVYDTLNILESVAPIDMHGKEYFFYMSDILDKRQYNAKR